MVQLEVKPEQVKEWFPVSYKTFLEELRNSKSKFADKAEEKIEWMISWGIYRTKAKNEEEQIQKDMDYENKLKLPYEERCAADLPKIRINISMKSGFYIRTDRSFDKEVPQYIIDMFYEVMKVTMLQEQMFLNDPVVMESLAEFQHLLDEMLENMESDLEGLEGISIKKKAEPQLNMDDILDKISESGMQSLTAKELKFLEKMSRGGN